MSKQAAKVSKLVRTAPERIFLQIADEDYSRESFPRPYGEEITWCETSCVECEVEYVRADLADEQRAELLEALILLLNEVDESAVANARDYGWPVAVAKSRAAIANATHQRNATGGEG